MDTSMMITDGFQNFQLDTSRRLASNEYIIDYSMFAQYPQQYPLSLGYLNSVCSSHHAAVDGFDTFGTTAAPQSLYPPPTYSDPPGLSHLESRESETTDSRNSPVVKSEDASPVEATYGFDNMSPQEPYSADSFSELSTSTDVDTLMRAIQTKSKDDTSRVSSLASGEPESGFYPCSPEQRIRARRNGFEYGGFRSRKKYQCHMPTCAKIFFQKTHLDIHARSHTGHKPFLCKEASCGQRFSQLGNLKTHERRHTGERPYSCESCGKRFAQRGNVRAHKIVHQQIKPFTCRLETCGKQFTQLGNLKSHQNKFHSATLRNLTHRFATLREGDTVSAADKDLWEYFTTLYKHSNKGIKGRGKDRRISPISHGNDGVKRELSETSSAFSMANGGGLTENMSNNSSSSNLEYGKGIPGPGREIWAG